MKVTIDQTSGFCSGVRRTILTAEGILEKDKILYCLGSIIHNEKELDRLKKKGLVIIDHESFVKLKNSLVLIRAHGEPPETFRIAKENNITLVDTTCRIVLRLQETIRSDFEELKNSGVQVVIFGKKGHPEVIGLNGQIADKAIVVSEISDIEGINPAKPILAYTQTTQDQQILKELLSAVEERLSHRPPESKPEFYFSNTTCKQVLNREKSIRSFAQGHDVILFVSDKSSSNGKYLFRISQQTNGKSFFVSDPGEIIKEWFESAGTVGITGGTSTPEWLLNQVAEQVYRLNASG
jgi:4-hydroxy-3-methylbut-2-enyl diphosphate reductase